MGAPKRGDKAMDVRSIREALPSARRHYRRTSAKPSPKPMPTALPECFADVWRRRHSTLPVDRQQRATLEAVASTIPQDVSSLTGQSAAAVYLAALILALQRLVGTMKPTRGADGLESEKPLSRKERKKQRKKDREAEDTVKEMAVGEVLRSKKKDQREMAPMNVDDEEGGEAGGSKNDSADSDVDLIVSLVSLIALAVRGTSPAVINAKCESILQVVMDSHDHVFGHRSVSRHTSALFAGVLAALESSSWAKPPVQRAYLYLLRSASDGDPKSRRKAREALDALLKSPRGAIVRARSSPAASAHFISELKLLAHALDETLNGDTVVEEKGDPVSLIHLLTAVERFAVYLNPQDAAKVAKELLVISVKNLPNISAFALTALNSVFKHRENASGSECSENDGGDFLPRGDLEKLLRAALRHEVSADSPTETIIAYNTCIASGAATYTNTFTFAPPPNEFIIQPIRKVLGTIDPRRGRTEVVKKSAVELKSLLSCRWLKCRPDILEELHSFTEPSYRPVWPDMIPILKRYLEEDMSAGNFQMRNSVKKVAATGVSIYEKSIKASDPKAQEMAVAIISSVVRGGGSARLLSVCEVRYDKDIHVTNAWVLPMLRDGLCGAPLSLFTSKLLPLAGKLKEAMRKTASEDRSVESKNLGIYYSQIWALLPGFCTKPSDLGQDGVFTVAFKAIHACFEADDRTAMYPIAVRSLRQLSVSVSSLDSEDLTTKKKIESFGGRLKKLFPTLASVAERTSDDRRGQLLGAITEACIAARDPSLVSSLLKKSIRRLLELQIQRTEQGKASSDAMKDDEDDTVRNQHAAADTAIAIAESKLVPHDAAETTFLEKAMSPFFLDGKESSLQKKAYRATALLVTEGATVKSHDELEAFSRKIAEARKNVAAGAKAARQGLIIALVNRHMKMTERTEKVQLLEFLSDQFLSEVILGTRDASEKTRVASFDTLIAMARGWNVTSPGPDMSGLQRFFIMVAAGLGGKTVPMLSATLSSLGRLMYDFRGEASANEELAAVVDSFFASTVSEAERDVQMSTNSRDAKDIGEDLVQAGPIAILLRHSAYEVQKSAMGVVKVATKALATPPGRLAAILPGIIPGLVHVAARSKKQETRLKVRVILERLLRRCGREVLEANFPQEHMRLLAAVRKKYSRDLIKKHAAKDKRKGFSVARKEEGVVGEEASDSDENDENEECGVEDSDSDIEREIVDGDDLLSRSKREREQESVGPIRVKEEKGQVMDLLDAKHSQSVLTEGDMKEASRAARLEQKRKRSRKDDVIKYTEDGRPIFVESDDDSGGAEVGSVDNRDDDSDSDDGRGGKHRRDSSGQKRQRQEFQDGERHSKKMKGSFGEEYRSRRGAGDVKRTGRPDPYAYIPLGAGMLGSKPGFARGKSRKDSTLDRLRARRGKKNRVPRTGIPAKR